MLALLIICCATAFVTAALLMRYAREHASLYGDEVPQRFHRGDIPRLGGVAMLFSCTVGWGWIALADYLHLASPLRAAGWSAAAVWLATAIPVLGGIAEDLTQRLPPYWRLALTVGAAVLAAGMLDLAVPRIGWAPVDETWARMPWLGVVVAILGISGLPHAFNLIDGYNGLAGLVAFICCFAIAYVALQVGDRQLAATVLALAGATAGFLLWNYPRGLIFAGDGGAYLWGVVIAIVTVQLVQRYPQVSPWFPVLLLIYPVWETLFSIYRKVSRGQSPGVADALHFHQLIYRRIVRGVFHDDEARRMLMRNNRTSPYLWGFTLLTVIPAVLFWNNTPVLVFFTALFVVSYVWVYVSIVRFRAPRWLRIR
ncbi:MAG TPA: glycosyltransferase [Ramlibacter sp.]|uniref:glycosyltransferase family 4 protein n=1 Tax=Ramlibacter sp. TaxID=1917967 RepID=UPI002C1B19E7|nr:glycosyltransferase [Ramlibacter sp.]HVZ46136.1 glycosyltransferase [Ramlibacter sp.]